MAETTTQDTSFLSSLVGKMGNESLRQANVGLSVAGPLIAGVENYLSAAENNKYQESAFEDALEFRQKEFKHNIAQFLANNARARATLSRNYHEVLNSIDQSRIAAQEEIWGIMHDLRKTQSRALNSAADREVYGNTINVLLDNIMANELRNIDNVAMEQKWGEEARMRTMSNLYSDAETQRLSSIPRPAGPMDVPRLQPMPNPVNIAMQAAGGALRAHSQFPTSNDPPANVQVDPNSAAAAGANILAPGGTAHPLGRNTLIGNVITGELPHGE